VYQEVHKEYYIAVAARVMIKSTAEISLSVAKFGIKFFWGHF
jgi:hypothetical protein